MTTNTHQRMTWIGAIDLCRLIGVVFLAGGAAHANAQELEPYADATISFSKPVGWAVIPHESGRFLIVRKDVQRSSGSPDIILQILPLGAYLEADTTRAWLNQHLGGTFRVEAESVTPAGAGRFVVYEKSRPSMKVAVMLEPNTAGRYSVFGLFIAPRADFVALDGTQLLARVVGSVLARR